MEGTTQPDGEYHWRMEIDSNITQQDLIDSYMLPFQACVEKGQVTSLMCSYNAVNGVPSCANDWLLQTVARENWGFDGYVTSDCDADKDVFNPHNYTATPEEAVAAVLKAGTDIDCGSFVTDNAHSALDQGLIVEDDLDTRLRMLFRVRMRLSHFDPVGPLDKLQASDLVCSDYALALSQDGVTQGATLLKNTDTRLPLNRGVYKNILVVGPAANLSVSDSGYYGPNLPCGLKYNNVMDMLQNSDPSANVNYIAGVNSVISNRTNGVAAAVAAAKQADLVILAIGTSLQTAREGSDATSIELSSAQQYLVKEVALASQDKVIILQFTATPLDISTILNDTNVGAVLHLGVPSVALLGAGPLLFGDRSPAGRTVQTIYPVEYQNMISIFDFNMRPGPSSWARPDCTNQDPSACPRGTNPGRTYRFYTGDAVIPFGFGLSYTNISYSSASPSSAVNSPLKLDMRPVQDAIKQTQAAGQAFIPLTISEQLREHAQWTNPKGLWAQQFTVNVTNTGNVAADDVVLGFLTPPNPGVDGAPLKSLFGFERVHVEPGETVSVYLYPALTDFVRVHKETGELVVQPGDYEVTFGVPETLPHGGGFLHAGTVRAW